MCAGIFNRRFRFESWWLQAVTFSYYRFSYIRALGEARTLDLPSFPSCIIMTMLEEHSLPRDRR